MTGRIEGPPATAAGSLAPRPRAPVPDGRFPDALRRAVQGGPGESVRLSAHAQARLQEAGRRLSEAELRRLGEAVDLVGRKGGRESLLLLSGLALLVSVPNRTVITAVAGGRLRESVFTQIDSAVVLEAPGLDLPGGGPLPRNDRSGSRNADLDLQRGKATP